MEQLLETFIRRATRFSTDPPAIARRLICPVLLAPRQRENVLLP